MHIWSNNRRYLRQVNNLRNLLGKFLEKVEQCAIYIFSICLPHVGFAKLFV